MEHAGGHPLSLPGRGLLLILLLSGCTTVEQPPASVTPSMMQEEFILEPLPSARAGGYLTTSDSFEIFSGRPQNLTGVLIEARPDRPSVEADVIGEELRVAARGEVIAETSRPDGRGVYVLGLPASDWRGGPLVVGSHASKEGAAEVSPSARVIVRTTLFFDGPPDWSLTQF